MDGYRQELGAVICVRAGVPAPKNENAHMQSWKNSPSHDFERQDFAMAKRYPSFAQQEILAPVELTKGKLIYVAKKDFYQCCTRAARRLKRALASDKSSLAAWEDITPLARNEWICWIETARKAETRSRRIALAVQTLRMENDAHVVGPDAPIVNSKTVKPDLRPADWNRFWFVRDPELLRTCHPVPVSLAALPQLRRCRFSSSSSSPRRHAWPHGHQPQAPQSARAG